MGCKCNERRASIARAGVAIAKGQVGAAAREIRQSASSFVQDLRVRETRRAMLAKLTKPR
jgi:hypothetical protein